MNNLHSSRPKPIRVALMFNQSNENLTLSYQHGWPRAILESPYFDCQLLNLANLSLRESVKLARQIYSNKYDAIILLHSVFSNQKNLSGALFWAVAANKAPKVYFVGNEYKHMPEKIRFSRKLGISLFISQSIVSW